MIQCIAEAVAAICGSLVLVRAAGALPPGVRAAVHIVQAEDRLAGRGPLAGMVAGMEASATDLCFVTSCDVPLLQPALIASLAEAANGYEAVCPRVEGRLQPLAAVYRVARALPGFRDALEGGRLRVTAAFADLNVRFVDEEALRLSDPRLDSFRSANTPAELRALERYARDEVGLQG
jgi:molybdopterin-guanine dinucleotide biosynthesis protein A